VGDLHHERALDALAVELDAAIAHEEDQAADDLAFSLMQDLSLVQALGRARTLSVVTVDGTELAVSVAGQDFVATGGESTTVVPLTAGSYIVGGGEAGLRVEDETLVTFLREWARSRRPVVGVTRTGSINGYLTRVTRDHLAIERGRDQVLIPLEVLCWIRTSLGGSTGAP
jgi:hypothetical protein